MASHTFLKSCYQLTDPAEVKAFYDDMAPNYDATLLNEVGYVAPQVSVDVFMRYLQDTDASIIDLGCGTARLKQNGGHGGHNGLRDIIQQLSTRSFPRLRIGIDHPGDSKQVVNYVLSNMTKADEASVAASIEQAIQVLPLVIDGDINKAMKALHTQTPPI